MHWFLLPMTAVPDVPAGCSSLGNHLPSRNSHYGKQKSTTWVNIMTEPYPFADPRSDVRIGPEGLLQFNTNLNHWVVRNKCDITAIIACGLHRNFARKGAKHPDYHVKELGLRPRGKSASSRCSPGR